MPRTCEIVAAASFTQGRPLLRPTDTADEELVRMDGHRTMIDCCGQTGYRAMAAAPNPPLIIAPRLNIGSPSFRPGHCSCLAARNAYGPGQEDP